MSLTPEFGFSRLSIFRGVTLEGLISREPKTPYMLGGTGVILYHILINTAEAVLNALINGFAVVFWIYVLWRFISAGVERKVNRIIRENREWAKDVLIG